MRKKKNRKGNIKEKMVFTDTNKLKNYINSVGEYSDLNHLDVSNITDMSDMFNNSSFNGDISKWDVSNVTDMSGMFSGSDITCDISNWDVSNVTDMSYMFHASYITCDISNWDVSNVTDMHSTFQSAKFNGDISNWDVSNVTDMNGMFHGSLDVFNPFFLNSTIEERKFNIGSWDVSSVTNMKEMFSWSNFNDDISNWDVSSVTNMKYMFGYCTFEGDVSSWDISSLVKDKNMFIKPDEKVYVNLDKMEVKIVKSIFKDCKEVDTSNWEKSIELVFVTKAGKPSALGKKLSDNGYKTLKELRELSDEDFLSIKDIGKGKLKTIREILSK